MSTTEHFRSTDGIRCCAHCGEVTPHVREVTNHREACEETVTTTIEAECGKCEHRTLITG